MSAPQSPERPARDGETCTCGRPAVAVYQTPKFGDVPYCGIEGHGAPQSPPECPDWCEVEDHEDDAYVVSHYKTFVRWNSPDDSRATSVIVRVRQYGDRAPYIRLWGYHDPHPISRAESHGITLDAGQARLLAAVITPEPVAQALRQAADELDRIGSAS